MRRHEIRLIRTAVVLSVLIVLVFWYFDTPSDDDTPETRSMKRRVESPIEEVPARIIPHRDEHPPAHPVYKSDNECRKDVLKDLLAVAKVRPPPSATPVECVHDITEDGLVLARDGFSLFPENDEFLPQALNPIHSRHTPQGFPADPRNSPPTLHYVWCRKREFFRFEDFIGIVSGIKVLEPLKVVFHYNELPGVDGLNYQTWLQELKQSYPMLELRKANREIKCGLDATIFGLDQIATSPSGGVFIGERTILTHMPELWKTEDYFSYYPADSDDNEGIWFAKKPYPENDLAKFVSDMLDHVTVCETEDDYDTNYPNINSPMSQNVQKASACVFTEKDSHYFPKDIMKATTPTYNLAKWFYYGVDGDIEAQPDPETEPLIPMIAHMFCLKKKPDVKEIKLPFNAYLGILSALHVAGFERLYIYGNIVPTGEWWDKLKGENITFVPLNVFDYVYQAPVHEAQHKTDVLRSTILHKYGGAYMDWDVTWSSPIPDSLRRYQMVGGMDWPIYREWPEAFNLGVAMAKPGATFLKHFLESFRWVDEKKWQFNALLMSYRLYEQYPHTMYLGKKLQVICFLEICHPTWHKNYIRPLMDKTPTDPFSMDEVQAFHFSFPDSPKAMENYKAMKNCDPNEMFCQLGRKILQQSGRMHELDNV